MMELYHSIDEGKYVFPTADYEALVGKPATSAQQWVEANKYGFGFEPAAAASAVVPESAGKTVIVGASGYIGKATVALLSRTIGGDKVIVATRNPDAQSADAFRAVGATVVAGDLNHIHTLKAVFAGASAVYVIAPGTEVGQDSRCL